MNIIFQINTGEKLSIICNYGTTINQALTKFLKEYKRPDLIGKDEDEIYFIYSTNKLYFWDQRKIEDVFFVIYPSIHVTLNNKKNKNSIHPTYYEFNTNVLPNNKQVFIHNNDDNKFFHFESEINRLKQLLDKEKNKNKILVKENSNLKQKIEFLNIKIEKLKTLEKNINDNNIMRNEYSFNSINPGEKILAVNFVSMGINDIGHYNLICKNNDLFVRLEERLYNDFPQFKEYETFFNVNGKRIKRFKTMDENNIKSNDVITIFINDN